MDPYLWLEDVGGERQLAWVGERNAACTGELTRPESFATLERRLGEILDSDARIPYISKQGPLYYNFWQDARHRRGLWRRTTLEEYRKPEPRWETVLDLDALAVAEHENWVWHSVTYLEPDCQRSLVSLSRGGADAAVVREFDHSTNSFVEGGFALPEAKSRVAWRGPDSIFVATDFGPGSLTRSGYPRIVKEWQRGTPLSEAVTVFESQPDDVGVSAVRDLTPGFERDLIFRLVTFWTNEMYLRRDGELLLVEKPADAQASVHRDQLFLELRSDWHTGGRTFPAGALLATDFEGFLRGERYLEVLFEPGERTSLAGFCPTRHHVLLNELDNVRNRVYVLTRENGRWTRAALPNVPEFSTVQASAVDPDKSDDFFMIVTGYLSPTKLSLGSVGGGEPEELKGLPSFFAGDGLSIRQHEAMSKDGTRIPYFEVARKELPLDGGNATLLYGYGGFEIALVPSYQPNVGAAWLENGGVYVVAGIRGGGEFGPRWHQAALKSNRHKAYEDFIAVAEDLVGRGVTSPRHLGIMGGSNGGLLMGNMLTRRPELFGAIVCQVPLLDMRRYHELLAGASWMGEYGNPDAPEDWDFIRSFSPYHNVDELTKYPRTLFTTSTRDDRVHPGHARKMVAKMLAQGHDVLYYENLEGGHAGAADNKQRAFMNALAYTFLANELKGK
jgi:prolyl oligopeptidase